MLDISDEQKKLLYKGGVFKDYTMTFDDIGLVITNDILHQEAVTIKESIIEGEEFVLGGCIASSIEFKVSEILEYDINGLEFTTNLSLSEGNVAIPMGTYRVNSANREDDNDFKKVIAYDALYDASVDVSSWYASYFANGATHTVKQTRESLLKYLGIPFVSQNLINDDVVLSLTADTSSNMPGTAILRSLCVLNGGFGKINRYGQFVVSFFGSAALFPEEDLYPEETLYPEDSFANLSSGADSPNYRKTSYEEYTVKPITALIIQASSEEAGVTIGSDMSNPYIIRSNFLLYGKSTAELKEIGSKILANIKDVVYRPNTTTLDGLPYMETGDVYTLVKNLDAVESYIFSRTLNGVQNLEDTYESYGEELRTNEVSVSEEIQRLQAKTSEIEEEVLEVEENLEETQEELAEFEETTIVRFEVNESSIEAEVVRATEAEKELGSRISITEDYILSTVAGATKIWDESGKVIEFYGYGEPSTYDAEEENLGKIYLDQESGKTYICMTKVGNYYWQYSGQLSLITANLDSKIEQNAESIELEVSRATNAEWSLESRISITESEIDLEVSRATSAENELSSRITLNENEISLKVSSGDVVSEINQSSDTIYLGAGQLVISAGNLQLDSYGNATFSGELSGASGTFSGSLSSNNTIFTGMTSKNGNVIIYDTGTGVIYSDELHAYNSLTTDKIYANDSCYFYDEIIYKWGYDNPGTTDANVMIGTEYKLKKTSNSSKRYKNSITNSFESDLDPERLYDVGVYQFKYNTDYLFDVSDQRYDTPVVGFIAEDMKEHYPIACDLDEFGRADNWNVRFIIPPMLALIQRQKKQIDEMGMDISIMKMQINNLLLGGNGNVS